MQRAPTRLGGAARRVGWLVWLVGLVVLVTGCQRSPESGASQPRRSPVTTAAGVVPAGLRVREYPVPAGSRPHDVAPAADGRSVWYTAQGSGQLGLLDPATGQSRLMPLGEGSAPHGVIVGPDGAPWVTDGGLNAILRVDPRTEKVDRYRLPPGRGAANLNSAAFRGGVLWFTGQAGVLGRLDPRIGRVEVFDAPGGRGPYVDDHDHPWLSDFAANALVRFDPATERFTVLPLPSSPANVRQLLGRPGEVWGAESGVDKLVVVHTG